MSQIHTLEAFSNACIILINHLEVFGCEIFLCGMLSHGIRVCVCVCVCVCLRNFACVSLIVCVITFACASLIVSVYAHGSHILMLACVYVCVCVCVCLSVCLSVCVCVCMWQPGASAWARPTSSTAGGCSW